MMRSRILKKLLGNDIYAQEKLRREIGALYKEIDSVKRSLGQLHSKMNSIDKNVGSVDIRNHEFQVYSQWGDDGIIQFLVNYLDIADKRFVEFGVQDYSECNTRFLLVNNNWSGLVMDGSELNISKVKADDICWRYDLKAKAAFITAENINDLLTESGFTGELGLLHIDVDGNDYWIWDAVNVVNPAIVIMEYNSLFGAANPWTVPYQPDFVRTTVHHSNLYYGASLLSLWDLAQKRGYSFIGCNSNGNNAYFIRKDKLKGLRELTTEEGFVASKFSESRNEKDELTYLRGTDQLELLRGLPVYNTRTEKLENL